MSSDKFENIYKLLTEHDFNTNKNIPDKLKCGKCRKILIKACQTQCGCRFCQSCVDEMLNNGSKFCPGITNDCKDELLSTVVIDHRANNKIAKLIMKCPEEMCSYEFKLLEMSEHLRICGQKSFECPFYKIGCDMNKMTNEKLIEHFQLENFNHNKTLIEMIDNVKNEIEELREKEINNHNEIKKLKIDLVSKNEEMETMKIEKCEMENRLRIVEESLNDEIVKLKSKHDKEMQLLKAEKKEVDELMRIELKSILHKIDELKSELIKTDKNEEMKLCVPQLIEDCDFIVNILDDDIDENESVNQKNKDLNNDENELGEKNKEITNTSIIQMRIKPRLNRLEKFIDNKMNGIFEMIIDNSKLLNKDDIWSDYFYPRTRPYKLRLKIWNSYLLGIYLLICDDLWNKFLSFPFTAEVTIKIININNRELEISKTENIQLLKPKNFTFNSSSYFAFFHEDLEKIEILDSNCFIVQCNVEFK